MYNIATHKIHLKSIFYKLLEEKGVEKTRSTESTESDWQEKCTAVTNHWIIARLRNEKHYLSINILSISRLTKKAQIVLVIWSLIRIFYYKYSSYGNSHNHHLVSHANTLIRIYIP